MFRSVRFRLAVSHGLVLAVILVVLGGALQVILARRLDTGATNDLLAAATGQVERIREAGAPVMPADSDVPSAASIQVAVYAGIPAGVEAFRIARKVLLDEGVLGAP